MSKYIFTKLYNSICLVTVLAFTIGPNAQILSTSNQPSQTYGGSKKGIPAGASVYGVFVGRTPCQEFLKELNLEEREQCAKRKMSVVLYHDSITHRSTTYKTGGMGKWSGTCKWQILKGTPTDPSATVFQLIFDARTSLFLLKGDDNVLFILDKNKNFLIGNEKFSYTLNRARN